MPETSPRRWVVTGASGFMGRWMQKRLRNEDCAYWDRSTLDLTDANAVSQALHDADPDIIMHLAAAGVSSDAANDPETIVANIRMAANLALGAKPGTTIVAAGTMAEYGHAGRLREDAPCTPSTAYAIGKNAAALFLQAYGPPRSLSIRVGRLFGVYGPGEVGRRLFPSLLSGLRAGRPVELSDGTQRRDFVHVIDACEALVRLALLDREKPLVVNIGTGSAVAIKDVAHWVAGAVTADSSLLRFSSRPRSAGDEDRLEADVTLLTETFGWAPPQRLCSDLDVSLLTDDDLSL